MSLLHLTNTAPFRGGTLIGEISGMAAAKEAALGHVGLWFEFEDKAGVAVTDVECGLAPAFNEKNYAYGWHMPEALNYGMDPVNSGLVTTAGAPFGGVTTPGPDRIGPRRGRGDVPKVKSNFMGGFAPAEEA